MVGIDILHAVDLGVAQDLAGNVLSEYIDKFANGRNRKEKVTFCWQKLKKYYSSMKPTSRLDALSWPMVKRDGKAPKLKAKGAETRGVVPFVVQLAMEMHAEAPDELHYKTVACCATSLLDFYILLDADEWDAVAGREASRTFCVLYSALSREAQDGMRWRQKPKLHMFQELAEYHAFELGHPARYWCYQDEGFVGLIAKVAMSRGGPSAAATTAKLTLNKFRALPWVNNMP